MTWCTQKKRATDKGWSKWNRYIWKRWPCAKYLWRCGVWQWNKCFSLGFENHRSNWRGRPDGQVILCKFGKADGGKKIKGLFWQRDCECSYNGYYSRNISSKHWGNLADYLAVDRLMKLFSEKVDKKRKFDVKFWYEVSCHETMYYCWQSILDVKGLIHKGLYKLLKII